MNVSQLLEYLLAPAVQIALVIGVAEVIKRSGFPARFIPILDLCLGIVSGIFVYGVYLAQGIAAGIIIGIAIGLSACGAFSGIKNVFGKHEEEKNDEGN